MTNLEWIRTLSEEEFADWLYDEWLHHLQYRWSSSRGGLIIWLKDHKTEPTISKMEQVDKDINVRSKDEPQTEYSIGYYTPTNAEILKAFEDEPQTELVNDSQILVKDLVDDEFNPYDEECMRCKHLKLQCEFVPSYCKYEPRDKQSGKE